MDEVKEEDWFTAKLYLTRALQNQQSALARTPALCMRKRAKLKSIISFLLHEIAEFQVAEVRQRQEQLLAQQLREREREQQDKVQAP